MPAHLPRDTQARPIVTIMVTYNRRSDVIAAAEAVLAQDVAPDQVVVIDNASTDGAASALRNAFGDRVDVVEMARNTGGAGGFAAALEIALAAVRRRCGSWTTTRSRSRPHSASWSRPTRRTPDRTGRHWWPATSSGSTALRTA